MNIVVCIKVTPSITAAKRFTADMRLERRKEDAEINPFDEYAIEEALRQQEKHGGEVIVLSMGPATATDTIRKALAIGAERGVLVTDPALEGSDAIGTARVLAAAIKKLGFDLVLFGSAAADSYGGVVPAAVAEFLGQPLLSFASKLDLADGKARIERAAETGYQTAEATLPALVSVIQTINIPRYPSMKGIMGAKKKPIDTFSLADLGVDAAQVGVAGAKEKATSSSPWTRSARAKSSLAMMGRLIASSPSWWNRRYSNMANDVWALAEIANGKLTGVSLQVASKAAELAGQLGGSSAAVALGTNTAAAATELGSVGVKTVYAADGAVYDDYLVQPHVETLAALVEQHQPAVILFALSNYGRDVAARLAARSAWAWSTTSPR